MSHVADAAENDRSSLGMILAAKALLLENPDPTEAQIRRGIDGNLCRCTGYQKIVAAIGAAAKKITVPAKPRVL